MRLLQEVDVLVGVQSHDFPLALLFLRQNASVIEFVPKKLSPLRQRNGKMRIPKWPFLARSAAQVLNLSYTNLTFDSKSSLSTNVDQLPTLRDFLLQTRDEKSKDSSSLSQCTSFVVQERHKGAENL